MKELQLIRFLKEVLEIAELKYIYNVGERAMKKSKVQKVMGEYKRGTLHSGSKTGPKVKSRKQAVAIALSEARKGKK